MINLTNLINEENYIRGLYQAQVGDRISIGREGDGQIKNRTTIQKILPNGNFVDERGNIFLPNGRLYKGGKGSQYQKQFNPGKEISAQLITQKELDNEYKKIKVDFLRTFGWDRMDIVDLEKIIEQLPIKQSNRKGNSRFEK